MKYHYASNLACFYLMLLLQMAGPYSSDGRDCKNGKYQESDSITVRTWRVSKSSWRKEGWFFFFQYPFFSKIVSQSLDSPAAIQIRVTKRMC